MAFQLEIVTPRGRMLSRDVDAVTLPGRQGEFTVLEAHIDLLSALKSGVGIARTGGASECFALRGGFAEVTGGHRLLVLSEDYAARDDCSLPKLQRESADIEASLRTASQAGEAVKEAGDSADLQESFEWVQARLELCKGGQN